MRKMLALKDKAANAVLAIESAAIGVMTPIIGHAGGFSSVTINSNALDGVNPFDIAGKGIGIILTILQIFGLGMLVFGVVAVVQSMQDNGNPDKRAQGFAVIAAAAVLIGMKFVLKAMGLIA